MKIEDRGILITGASRGLGAALAHELAARGARLLLVARDAAALDAVVDTIAADGGEAHAFAADIGDKDAIHPLVGAAGALLGDVDVVVHNAGTLGAEPLSAASWPQPNGPASLREAGPAPLGRASVLPEPPGVPATPPFARVFAPRQHPRPGRLRVLADTDCEALQRALDVNVLGPFRLTKALVGPMLLRDRGLIVHITSDAAIEAYPEWGAYGASKAALDHLSRTWAAELAGTGVRFFGVDPGEMDTAMHAAALPSADRSALRPPADAARRIAELLADPSVPGGARIVLPAAPTEVKS